jgi:aspartyl-tRNA synthetase
MGKIRIKLGEMLDLIKLDCFKFCFIIDFPFYELNEENGKIDFSHNPFSMPQGGLEILESAKTQEDLLAIEAYQYDIVCNGIELSSGAIRNHKPEIMYKAFEIAGYSKEEVDKKFGGMIKAFKFGAPPHGGIAPGIDRMIMLLADAANIREIIAFPLNQQAEDLLMNAPDFVTKKQLKELHIHLLPIAEK